MHELGRKSRSKRELRQATQPNPQGQVVRQEVSYSQLRAGPLPDPETLKGYGEVLPGLPQTMADSYVAQGDHRRRMERWVILNDIIGSHLGTVVGGALAFVIVWRSTEAILQGHVWVGSGLVVGTLASMVYAFVKARKAQEKEVDRKRGQGQ